MTPFEFCRHSLTSMQKQRRGQGFRRATLLCMHCVNEGTKSGVLCSPDGFRVGPINSQQAGNMLPATQCYVFQGGI